jgi:hypothetical protein
MARTWPHRQISIECLNEIIRPDLDRVDDPPVIDRHQCREA